MSFKKVLVLSAAVFMLAPELASAATVTTANPGQSTEIGARIRWGNTGFEASIFDNSPFAQTPTLNPGGTPVWQLNAGYNFQVGFDTSTGTLSLAVDFNRDNSFGAGESISRSAFVAPGQTSYQNLGFKYLSISGNESGSTARSNVSNLVINGTSLPGLAPVGLFSETFYKDSSLSVMTAITIAGTLTFTTAGTSQERPSWNFNFIQSAAPEGPTQVPVPAAFLLYPAGLGVMGVIAWKRRRRNEAVTA